MGFFSMKNIFKIVFVIIGTLIGAGFASGQEMYLFFFSYGIKGIAGIIVSSLVIGYVIYKTFDIIKKYPIHNYKDFLDIIIKEKRKTNVITVNQIINLVINIFIIITFVIMIAGFGAYFEQEFRINSMIGSSLLAMACFWVFTSNTKGMVKVNEIIIPILITSITIIGLMNLKDIHIENLAHYMIRTNPGNWLISGFLYASYNSILLIPVLITLKQYLKNKKQILGIATLSTVITLGLSLIVCLLLIKIDVDITILEMPIVYVVSHMIKIIKIIYGFIILGSIFTTATSLGTSFLQNTSKNKKSYTQIAFIMCITSIVISKIGFSNLINLLYPIFGYLGMIQILILSFHKTNSTK